MLASDNLTPGEHLAILTKLIIAILEIGKESGMISKETLLQAKIKIVTAILQGE